MKNRTCQMPRRFRSTAPRLLAIVLVALGVASGCAAPASVEGIFSEIEIAFDDPRPAMRVDTRGDQVHVMISEETDTTLTVAQLRLPSTELNVGDTFTFDLDKDSNSTAWLRMTRGAVEVDVLSDGTRVVSSRDHVVANSSAGTVTLDDVNGVLAGSFHAELDDGGEVDGRFLIEQ